MIRRNFVGTVNGLLASISYGTNPLFAIPLYACGFSVNSVLFYRYFFAVLIYVFIIKFIKKISLKVSFKQMIFLFILGLLFSFSSLTLFKSFKFLDSGIACTILFVYPMFTAIIMAIFFKEKITLKVILSMFCAFVGIFLLSVNNVSSKIDPYGIVLVLSSALLYALYMVGVKKFPYINHLKAEKLNFYTMLFGLLVYVFTSKFGFNLDTIDSVKHLFFLLMLSIFPTIISIETINIAIKLIGSTKTAILGTLEPLSAIFFGVLFFGERLNFRSVFGIILILCGISFVVVQKQKNTGSQN